MCLYVKCANQAGLCKNLAYCMSYKTTFSNSHDIDHGSHTFFTCFGPLDHALIIVLSSLNLGNLPSET